jgi:LPXTG-site transpeptidase (sortase) family protein
MGKHDSDESAGFFLGGVEAVKSGIFWLRDNLKIIGIIALIPIVGAGAYFGVNYYTNHKNSNNETVPVASVLETDDSKKEYVGGYEVLGEVKINGLGIDVKVLNSKIGDTDYTDDALKHGAVLYYGDGINEPGNTTIIAHNNADNFYNLKNLEVDDEFTVVGSNSEEITYTVIEIKNVEPDDLSVLLPMEENSTEITLITCETEGTTRLVVKAISK